MAADDPISKPMREAASSEATEDSGAIPVQRRHTASGGKQEPRQFLRTARRDLSEDELTSPAARRFLIAEIERLDERCLDLRLTENNYHDLRVENAKLTQGLKENRRIDVLLFVCSAVGAAGIGSSPSFIGISQLNGAGWVILVFSAILLLVGAFFRLIK